MHQSDRGIKQGDRLLKMQGKLDRGPVEFTTHIAEQEGLITSEQDLLLPRFYIAQHLEDWLHETAAARIAANANWSF